MKKVRFALALIAMAMLAQSALMQDATAEPTAEAMGDAVVATPGADIDMLLMPKLLGIAVFDEAHEGAQEAHDELENAGELIFNAPSEGSAAGQIEIIESAITQGVGAIMISANDYDQLLPSTQKALEAGIDIVTWDSPVDPTGEELFIAQVDFSETGIVMADMALNILGEEGGEFAVLSATPDASNQNAWIAALEEALKNDEKYANLKLVATVYGNDDPEDSYNEALGLVDSYPDLGLIMAPTTVGVVAAAKAMQDEGLCGEIAVSGLGLPAEMQEFVENGCSQEFALWSFKDLGYLTYYVSYLLATDAIEPAEGVSFEAGRMGTYTIEADPTREGGLRVLMGPFSTYSMDNYDDWAVTEDMEATAEATEAP